MQSSFLNPEFISLLGVLVISGIITVLLAGLFGVGGGIVLVPALLYVFDEMGYNPEFTTHMAIGARKVGINNDGTLIPGNESNWYWYNSITINIDGDNIYNSR